MAVKGAAKDSARGDCNWLSSGFKGAVLEAPSLQQTVVGAPGAVLAFADVGKGDYHLAKPDPPSAGDVQKAAPEK